mmetsp:Transcript_21925/g.60866  ORF Transcript_21925/g.60866 Transcript_21925/m.60866 type:complete len:245 (+) Transcript_21925:1087-1821(+)
MWLLLRVSCSFMVVACLCSASRTRACSFSHSLDFFSITAVLSLTFESRVFTSVSFWCSPFWADVSSLWRRSISYLRPPGIAAVTAVPADPRGVLGLIAVRGVPHARGLAGTARGVVEQVLRYGELLARGVTDISDGACRGVARLGWSSVAGRSLRKSSSGTFSPDRGVGGRSMDALPLDRSSDTVMFGTTLSCSRFCLSQDSRVLRRTILRRAEQLVLSPVLATTSRSRQATHRHCTKTPAYQT